MAKFPEIESAVVSLDKQVKILTSDLQKLITTVNSNSKSQSDLATKTRTVGKATESLSALQKERANVAKQTQKVFAKTLALQEKGTQKLLKGKIRLREEQRKLNQSLKEQLGISKKSNGLFRNMTKSILAAGGAMFGINAAFGVAKKVIGDAFKTIVGFEKAMSGVKAITNASDEEFKKLVESAKELGSVTPKTASEVAGLQTEFAKLGFSTAEILAATEATISLSIAAGADLAESATVAASTLRGFGLSANETQRVVDVMANSFSNSGLDIEKFKESMKLVAPTARATGRSIEETTALLGTLADNGISGSVAGTQLNRVFIELNKQGLTLEDALGKVTNSSNKLGEATDLVGDRGAKALLILAENTEQSAKLKKGLDEVSISAQEMADIMSDNLAGDIDKAKSAWEGLILSMEDGSGFMNTIFRGAVQSATTELGNLQKMFKGVRATVEDDMVEVFDKYVEKLKETKTNEEILTSLQKSRANFVNKLEGATKKETKALNINIAALDKSIEKVKEAQKVDEDAIKATEAAAAEQERVRTELAIEEAEKRAAARERIALKRAKRQIEINDRIADDDFDTFVANLERENAAFEELLDEQGEININAVNEQLAAEEEAKLKAANKEIAAFKAKEELKKELILAGIDAAEKIVSDRFNAGIDERLNSTLEANEAQQQILQDRLDKGLISEEQFEKESKALQLKSRQEEARANKKKAQFDNIINTLVAVGKTFATLGFPAGIIPAGIVAGIGAANTVAIAAEPIPKFRTGVKDFEGGLAYVHSGEIVDTKNGMFATPQGETLVNIPKGSDVLTAQESAPILKDKDSREFEVLKSIDKKLSSPQKAGGQTILTPKGKRYLDEQAGIDKTYIDLYS